MATTTNFGWETPDDTDLVKDGAAAIRTVANSIDTSFVDLKGGTTGQILAKASNTDLDYTWTTDATGIPATIFDAKGDLIAASAADTAARLAVGTNGHVLTADSTTATGLKWAATSAPAFVGCSLYKSGNQSLNNNSVTQITFDSEDYDTDGFHSTVTNTQRITIPAGQAGKYLLTGCIYWESLGGSGYRYIRFTKNTTVIAQTANGEYNSGVVGTNLAYVVDLAVGDYVFMSGLQTYGTAMNATGGAGYTFFQAIKVG